MFSLMHIIPRGPHLVECVPGVLVVVLCVFIGSRLFPARLRGEIAIAARAPGDTGADPGTGATAPNPLVGYLIRPCNTIDAWPGYTHAALRA